MSDDRFEQDTEGAAEVERRLTEALASFASGVRPDPGGWDRIDDRLGEGPRRGAGALAGSARRPVLVAAALLIVALTAAVLVGARSGGDEVELATAPASPPDEAERSIVAILDGHRLVELGLDGQERRELFRTTEDDDLLLDVAVSPDGVVYVTRGPGAWMCYPERESPGEIIAIPLGGGEPQVVVTGGHRPTVDDATGRLAYQTTPDGSGCPGDALAIGIVDPVTGANELVALHPADGPTPGGSDGSHAVDLPSLSLSDLSWSADGDAIWALMSYASGLPSRAFVRISAEPERSTSRSVDIVHWVASAAGGDAFDPFVGASSFDVWAGDASSERFVVAGDGLADPAASVEVERYSFEREGSVLVTPPSSAQLATIGPASGGERLFAGEVDVDPTTGDLLVTAYRSRVEPPVVASDGLAPTTDGASAVEVDLYVVADGSARLLPTSVVAAAWLRTGKTEPVAPVPTSPADMPSDPPETTTVPGTSVVAVPGTSAPEVPGTALAGERRHRP